MKDEDTPARKSSVIELPARRLEAEAIEAQEDFSWASVRNSVKNAEYLGYSTELREVNGDLEMVFVKRRKRRA